MKGLKYQDLDLSKVCNSKTAVCNNVENVCKEEIIDEKTIEPEEKQKLLKKRNNP